MVRQMLQQRRLRFLNSSPDPVQAKASITGFGQSPRLHIVSNDYFYADGTYRYPVRYNMAGMAVDGFQNECCPGTNQYGAKARKSRRRWQTTEGRTALLNLSWTETLFDCSIGEYGFVTPQQFDLFQFKDDKK